MVFKNEISIPKFKYHSHNIFHINKVMEKLTQILTLFEDIKCSFFSNIKPIG